MRLLMDAERRRRFSAWFFAKYKADTAESRKRFMADSGLSKGRITQLFDEKERFGELAAKRTALAVGLPEDAFLSDPVQGKPSDQPETEGTGLGWFVGEITRMFLDMSQERRDVLIAKATELHNEDLRARGGNGAHKNDPYSGRPPAPAKTTKESMKGAK